VSCESCNCVCGPRRLDPDEAAAYRELGSGTGLVGLCAASFGPRSAILTDNGAHQSILRLNVGHNAASVARDGSDCLQIMEYDWPGQVPPGLDTPVDVVLATDVAYHPELYEPLIKVRWEPRARAG
jgi:predicted nicotinamide N-methyase